MIAFTETKYFDDLKLRFHILNYALVFKIAKEVCQVLEKERADVRKAIIDYLKKFEDA